MTRKDAICPHLQSGSGVGLGLCFILIMRHDGQIGVESTLGKGSTFWFTLPLAKERKEGTSMAIGEKKLLIWRLLQPPYQMLH